VIVTVVEMYIGNGCEEGCRVCNPEIKTICTNCDISYFMQQGTDNCLTECPTG
jgi:hypothetical protein